MRVMQAFPRMSAMRSLIVVAFTLSILPIASATPPASPDKLEKGEIAFKAGDQKKTPALYRLDDHAFAYELEHRRTLPVAGVEIFDLRFPSPVETKYAENNTVHAEYYRPAKRGKFPGVVVLDITAGDQTLSRV